MYPKDCCKIQPSDANHIPTHYIHIQSCHHIMVSRFARAHEFDNIAYNIIPFVSNPCGLHRLLFFYNFLPLPQSEYYII